MAFDVDVSGIWVLAWEASGELDWKWEYEWELGLGLTKQDLKRKGNLHSTGT